MSEQTIPIEEIKSIIPKEPVIMFKKVSNLLSKLQENIIQLKEFGVTVDCNINADGVFCTTII